MVHPLDRLSWATERLLIASTRRRSDLRAPRTVRSKQAGRELNPRHADFQAFRGDFRGLSINHLQRLATPFPGTQRHNPATLNLSSTHSWHRALRRGGLITN